MDTSLFDYDLPADRIASVPADRRDGSKLMVYDRETGVVEHRVFRELPELLPGRTRLFRNVVDVLRARIPGKRPTGGAVECLLLRPTEKPDEWLCLLRPGKKAADAAGFGIPGEYHAHVVAQIGAEYRVRFVVEGGRDVATMAERVGSLPLPPYIERAREEGRDYAALDNERYRTVFADESRRTAAAAPTAGLHFTPEVLERLSARGFAFHDLTLNVGLGTFKPIEVERVEDHPIHREVYRIPDTTVRALLDKSAGPRLAVGTTALRAAEDFCRKHALPEDRRIWPDVAGDWHGEADIYVYPPDNFMSADMLLTNFHLPRSTLLCLVSAFLSPGSTDGIGLFKKLYAEAIARDYRFYSYGDAMLIR